jgi:GMP synthase-like glutamine amidotransferase
LERIMKVHYLQHVPFEGIGSIEAWLITRGAQASATRFYESAQLPHPDDFDWLIVMGGPMSVNDEQHYPWLIAEKRLIREAIARHKVVLGICLGAQLIANALGARVYPNPEPEIGWFPIERVATAKAHPCATLFPARCKVFHWHGETFDLPPGAVHLAQSTACTHQAFLLGQRVLGLQFHLETTPASVQALVDHCGAELPSGRYVQSAQEMLATAEHFARINRLMADILGYLECVD